MKKELSIILRFCPVALLTIGIACSSFEPVTSLGKDVVKTVDPAITDLAHGYNSIESNLEVTDAGSLIASGQDTKDSVYKTESGVHPYYISAGTFSHENVVSYVEMNPFLLHNDASKLASLRAACSTSIDSAYLILPFAKAGNDSTLTTTITVYSVTALDKFGSAINFDKDSNKTVMSTFTVTGNQDFYYRIPLTNLDSNNAVAIIKKGIVDTSKDTNSYAKLGFYITAQNAAGIVHFSSPSFCYKYSSSCSNANKDSVMFGSLHYGESVTESQDRISSENTTISSWGSDRFTEIVLNLKDVWDNVVNANGGKKYAVISEAACSLSIDNVLLEPGLAKVTIVYGLLDHQLSTRLESKSAFDTLKSMVASKPEDRLPLKLITVTDSTTNISIPVTYFIQGFTDRPKQPEKAFLYLFAYTDAGKFAKITWKSDPTIKFSALLSNPH